MKLLIATTALAAWFSAIWIVVHDSTNMKPLAHCTAKYQTHKIVIQLYSNDNQIGYDYIRACQDIDGR